MNRFTAAGLLGSLVLMAGCGSAEDREINAGVSKVAAHRSAHPHFPLMAFDDFGTDNGPVGVPIDVYGYYCHATTKPNPVTNVLTTDETAQRLANVFSKAILSLKSLEASTPGPHSPPANPDWKQAPHPELGTYEIVVKTGPKTHTFLVPCPVKSGESAAAAVEKVTPQLLADAKEAVSEHLTYQKAQMRSLAPPPGFTLATQEMLNQLQGSRAVEPHLIGDTLCLLPMDKPLAIAGLDHSIQRLLTATSQINPKPEVAHLVINGPGFEGAYTISLTPGKDRDQAIATAEKAVGSRLDELNRRAS